MAATENNKYELLVSSVVDYAIYLLDANGMVDSWNHGCERNTGYAESEALGQHFSCFYTEEDQAAGVPEQTLEAPSGVVSMRINPDTGLRDDSSRYSDWFLAEFAPRMAQDALAPAAMPGGAPARDVRDQLF